MTVDNSLLLINIRLFMQFFERNKTLILSSRKDFEQILLAKLNLIYSFQFNLILISFIAETGSENYIVLSDGSKSRISVYNMQDETFSKFSDIRETGSSSVERLAITEDETCIITTRSSQELAIYDIASLKRMWSTQREWPFYPFYKDIYIIFKEVEWATKYLKV